MSGIGDARAITIDYASHDRVDRLIDAVRACLESISVTFDRWDEALVKGPGLYVAVVSGPSIGAFADPMSDDRWPVDVCPRVLEDVDRFYRTARGVAFERDGAVVVSVDGEIQERMVRFNHPSTRSSYADWMGARHMSAVDTSLAEEVVATLTLSEESGRVTVCRDGDDETLPRGELGGRWRAGGTDDG